MGVADLGVKCTTYKKIYIHVINVIIPLNEL